MRVAVLGAGRIGSFRARVLKGLPGVDEIVVGNRTVERAEKLAGEVGGEGGTIQEALDSGPDAVFVSLATELHAEWLHRCIDAGLPIFCEKPIALTLEETAEQLGISTETVSREWRRAKAWLYKELQPVETTA